jgi:trigger factor
MSSHSKKLKKVYAFSDTLFFYLKSSIFLILDYQSKNIIKQNRFSIMPNILEEKVGNLTARVTVTIPYSEYGPKVKKELSQHQKKAAFKGFRPGKTPMSFIQKMYGQQVMANEMNKMLQDSMMEYLEDKDIFGQPVPVDEIESFNLKSKEDYNFVFEVGFEPTFELNLAKEIAFNKEVIKIDEKYLNRELQEVRHRNGEVEEEGEEVTSENDVLRVRLQEMEGDAVKEGGVTSETFVGVDLFATEDLKKKVMGLKVGDTFTAKYTEISKEFTEDRVKRYILKLEEDENGNYPEVNEMFQAEILTIRQVKIATLNQEFFDKTVGVGTVTTEEEFKTVFGERVVSFLQQEANTRLFLEVQKTLIAQNDIEFPEEFLKKWLLFRNDEKTAEEIDAEMPEFTKSLKWMMIKGQIQKAHDLEVNPAVVKEGIKAQFRQYMQGQSNDEMLNMLAEQVLNSDDEQTVEMRERAFQDALNSAVFEKLEELVTINETEIAASDFDVILTAEYEAKQKADAEKAAETAAAEVAAAAASIETIDAEIEVEEVISTEEEEDFAAEIDTEVENMADEAEQEITG